LSECLRKGTPGKEDKGGRQDQSNPPLEKKHRKEKFGKKDRGGPKKDQIAGKISHGKIEGEGGSGAKREEDPRGKSWGKTFMQSAQIRKGRSIKTASIPGRGSGARSTKKKGGLLKRSCPEHSHKKGLMRRGE